MKKTLVFITVFLVLISIVFLTTKPAIAESRYYSAGAFLRDAFDELDEKTTEEIIPQENITNQEVEYNPDNNDPFLPQPEGDVISESMDETIINVDLSNVAAKYKENFITWTEVEYARNTAFLHDESYQTSDKAIVDHIIRGMILVEMAEERGVAATNEEIESMLENTRLAYEIPEGKEMIDEYCQGLGVSFEGYLEILRSQAYETISMQKMRDQIAKDVCDELKVNYSKNNLPEYVKNRVESYLNSVIDEYIDDIEYYF